MQNKDLEKHLDERIGVFERQLKLIESCREKELGKAFDKRSFNILYMLHRDKALFEFCLSELITIKAKLP